MVETICRGNKNKKKLIVYNKIFTILDLVMKKHGNLRRKYRFVLMISTRLKNPSKLPSPPSSHK